MNYIIFDLEATCWRGRPRIQQETIEIGAVKINEYAEVVGVFNRFIKPVINPILSAFCRELTSISQVDINRADKFPKVIEDFQDWIEIFDEDYLFGSWGDFDKRMLKLDCQLHDYDTEWLDHHINLKNQYRDIKKFRKPKGLKSATELEGFEFTGIHHRAIADAENLAKIFCKYFDEWRY